MYINKMVYAERYDFNDEDFDFLMNNGIIAETDYNTTEIMKDTVIYNKEDEKIIETLEKTLGKEVTEALLNEEIDLVMIV